MTAAPRVERLIAVAVWLLAVACLIPYAFRGWIPHDEGLLGQLGERTLGGALPHLDFVDPYTGGLSFVYAAAFAVLGVASTSIRLTLLLAVAATVPFLLALMRRVAPLWLAALAMLVALAWTVPVYFAGLPSWYGLLLAIVALWTLIRHRETGDRRWLFVAVLCTGISCTIKITGLYLVAGSLLAMVDAEHRGARRLGPDAVARRGRGFVWICALGGLAFVAALVALVAPGSHRGFTGSTTSLLLHYVVPGAALTAYLIGREGRARLGVATSIRVCRLAALAVPYLAGFALPVAVLVVVFAARGGVETLESLRQGVFVLPQKRFGFATFPLPTAWSVLAAVPIGALVAWPRPVAPWLQRAAAAVVGVALAAVVASAGRDAVYQGIWLPLRALVPVATLAGLAVLVGVERRDKRSDLPAREALFPVLAVTAMASLIQYPDAFGIYFLYVAPLVVLALVAIAKANRNAVRAPLLAALLFAGAFAVGWLHRGHPGFVGVAWRKVVWDYDLDLPRGGLRVDRKYGAQAQLLAKAVLARARPGDAVFAAPDCPEVAFLTGTRDPLRSAFGFFDHTLDDPVALEAMLERENVRVAVINLAPDFSAPLDEPVLRMLRRRYPRFEQVGEFIVLW